MADDKPDPKALSELFADYNPQGALNNLFAPAYIRGYAPSEQAVAAWSAANRPVTAANIEQSRMPALYGGPSPMSAGNGAYGGPMPLNQSYLDPRGSVDPLALQSLAQGGPYDWNARRNAIAARLAANMAAGAPTGWGGG